MGHLRTTRVRSSMTRVLFYCNFILLFFFLSAQASVNSQSSQTSPCLDVRCSLTGTADIHSKSKKLLGEVNGESINAASARRFLSGPGSSPPRCTSKCGSCKPCKPVHVPVPPGTPVTAEYYPEAWRCKCGNKLYMP